MQNIKPNELEEFEKKIAVLEDFVKENNWLFINFHSFFIVSIYYIY
jgi:hypothetical protein